MAHAKRDRETPEFAAMVRRVITAHGRRVADADPEDLGELAALHDAVEAALRTAVDGQRDAGASWARIALGLGITKQAAQQRFGHGRPAAQPTRDHGPDRPAARWYDFSVVRRMHGIGNP